jgi:hypothetical protein
MEITNNDKIAILAETMKQRYTEVEQMRNRAFQIVTWTIGVFLLLVGWIVQGTTVMSITQKIFLSLAICFASGSATWFTRDLEKGFSRQFQILSKIETLLGLYEPGFFDASEESIFPQVWAEKPGSGKFFIYVQLLLALATIFVVAVIFLSGIAF